MPIAESLAAATTSTSTATVKLGDITYVEMTAPYDIPSDQSLRMTKYSVASSVVSEVAWQLYSTKEMDDAAYAYKVSMWDANYNVSDFDLRDKFDFDGYSVYGKVTFDEDTEAGGYIYACLEEGKSAGKMSCAYATGDPTAMSLAANQGVATASSLIDFSKVKADNPNVPYEYDLTTTFTKKTCPFYDGISGCWKMKFTKATAASTFEMWMYQASYGASEESGFRIQAGDEVEMGFIVEKYGGYGQNHWGTKVKLEGASHLFAASAALVMGAATYLF